MQRATGFSGEEKRREEKRREEREKELKEERSFDFDEIEKWFVKIQRID